MEKKVYCTILNQSFLIDYTSEGLNQFNCIKAFIDSNGEMRCDDVQIKGCPLYDLLNVFARKNPKALDELVKGE